MGTLTKRDLVVQISNDTGMIQRDVMTVIQRMLDAITDSLSQGEIVELRNFGVFNVRLTKPRVGRNPNRPDHEVLIPARAVVRFKSGKIMRQRVDHLAAKLKRAAASGS
jgi:nucleoid DNA-binding protein